jgi:hypothetical protein
MWLSATPKEMRPADLTMVAAEEAPSPQLMVAEKTSSAVAVVKVVSSPLKGARSTGAIIWPLTETKLGTHRGSSASSPGRLFLRRRALRLPEPNVRARLSPHPDRTILQLTCLEE